MRASFDLTAWTLAGFATLLTGGTLSFAVIVWRAFP